jgi:hypothetical protein
MVQVEQLSLQSLFLRGVEDVIPTNSSLVAELSDILEISTDSAYRRMRGETLLTINEIAKLCEHFNISFDAFSKVESGTVTFSYVPMEVSAESFANYLQDILKELMRLGSAKEARLAYVCGDIPLFYHFGYPELGNFIIFYWMRTIMNLPDLSKVKYDADFKFPEMLELGRLIYEAYIKIPSVEIWTESTIKSTLKQIGFYWESGIFESKEDALRVCAALSKQIEDIEQMAEVGTKISLNSNIPNNNAENERERVNFKLYVSDIELNNNCSFLNIGDLQMVSLGHLSFSSMSTTNEKYCNRTEEWITNITKKSTLISGASEKQRFQFFQKINGMIDDMMKNIANS